MMRVVLSCVAIFLFLLVSTSFAGQPVGAEAPARVEDAADPPHAEQEQSPTSGNDRNAEPEASPRANVLMSQLQTVRSQIELYRQQHGGKAPDLLKNWDQLTGNTNWEGELGEGVGFANGPYLAEPAFNGFTKSRKVSSIQDVGYSDGWAWDAEKGKLFAVVSDRVADKHGLLEEDVVVYSAARAAEAQAAATKADLAVLRNAIDLYAVEHGGNYPDHAFVQEQLTQYTNLVGDVSQIKKGEFIYGPYIRKIPVNKATSQRGVSPLDGPTEDSAWAYSDGTGEIVAVIPDPEIELEVLLGGDWVRPIATQREEEE